MATILDTIADANRARVAEAKERISLDELRELCEFMGPGKGYAFKKALGKESFSFICEVKKASPSKGVIAEDFPYVRIAREYEAAGADAISCLTEPKWFLGSDEIFRQIRADVCTPMIRKDFTVDPYQLYEARTMGANAILLICSLMDARSLSEYLELAGSLGLAALVETHDEDEVKMAVAAGAEIIGVNNRNLKDFTVDFENAKRLRNMIPAESIYVAESGVKNAEDVAAMAAMGADAALIGEALMRADSKADMLASFHAAAAKGRSEWAGR